MEEFTKAYLTCWLIFGLPLLILGALWGNAVPLWPMPEHHITDKVIWGTLFLFLYLMPAVLAAHWLIRKYR